MYVAAIVGLIIFFVMLIVVIIQKDSSEWFRPLAGLIFDAIALLFFKRSDKANERVDKIQMRLDETEKILLAIKLVEIADSETHKNYSSCPAVESKRNKGAQEAFSGVRMVGFFNR